MFVRFRRSHHRLKVYILENVRRDGCVRQEIVAYLGSVDAHLLLAGASADERASIMARIAFWETANPKLRSLANRLGPDQQRLRMAVHARIPWPKEPERDHRLKVLDAEHEAKWWRKAYDLGVKGIEAREKMKATVEKELAEARALALNEINQANMWTEEAARRRRQ